MNRNMGSNYDLNSLSIINLHIQKMKTAFLLLAIAATVLAVTIEQPKQLQLATSRKALQFNNFTGAGATNQHITAFINLANSASAFYKTDVEANARYIKEGLDSQFGVSNQNFFVVIQTEQERFSWLVWITNENLIASLSGINKVNPSWSYLFLKFLAPPTSADYAFIKAGTKGSGITSETESFIASIVNTYEEDDECTCNDYDTMNIGYGLINGQGLAWSTICSATPGLNAYVYTVGGLWIHAKPRNCYYTFYVSQ